MKQTKNEQDLQTPLRAAAIIGRQCCNHSLLDSCFPMKPSPSNQGRQNSTSCIT